MKTRQFTLLETIIAIAVFSLLATTLAMVMRSARETWEQTAWRRLELEELLTIERFTDSAFRNTVPFSWVDDTGAGRPIFLGKANRLIFAYRHRVSHFADGGLRFVSLTLDGEALKAEYRKTPILWWDEGLGELSRESLAKGLESATFRYADQRSGELVWLDEWEENNPNIPMAIQLTLRWRDGRSETWLRRTAGNSYGENYGRRFEFR